MNDTEREHWIWNDQALYQWWRSKRIGVRPFVRENRVELDAAIARLKDNEPTRPDLGRAGA